MWKEQRTCGASKGVLLVLRTGTPFRHERPAGRSNTKTPSDEQFWWHCPLVRVCSTYTGSSLPERWSRGVGKHAVVSPSSRRPLWLPLGRDQHAKNAIFHAKYAKYANYFVCLQTRQPSVCPPCKRGESAVSRGLISRSINGVFLRLR
jgi:hypothetical protein